MNPRHLLPLLLTLACTALAACTEQIIDTPYVMYGDNGKRAFDRLPEASRTPDIKVFYFTDRAESGTSDRGIEYGYRRGTRSSFGTATVSLGPDVTWDQLVADSTRATREGNYTPKVTRIERAGIIPPIADFMHVVNGRLTAKPTAEADFDRIRAQIAAELKPWIEASDRREAVIFIHGFNNSFDDAVLRLAQAWHFTGRRGIPIVYSWPAGSPGLLNYAYDRESGEFTIVHLKILLTTLAACPQIERVHILSHSRGTDVAVTALRELNAELRGAEGYGLISRTLRTGRPPGDPAPRPAYEMLKLHTLILAAPDLDAEVFSQRFVGENMLQCCRTLIVYFSAADSALEFADWLFGSRARVGSLRIEDFTPQQREILAKLDSVQLINCNLTGYSSHSYFVQHPSALSDLILIMGDERPPGAANGRPLRVPFPGAWEMDDDYLRPTSGPGVSPHQLNTPQ